jgi:hypothetical protein
MNYRHRRAVTLENELLQVAVTVEGGHIAAITDKASGVNPLWTPPWPSIEPSSYDPVRHPDYGEGAEAKLLAGILGHNLCLDYFGGPTDAEAAAGMTVHGEASVAEYDISVEGNTLRQAADFPESRLRFERLIHLPPKSRVVVIVETVENLSATERPIGWTQHVTLGPPFLQKGATTFRANATKSKVLEANFAGRHGYQQPGAEFDWPFAPLVDGGQQDLRLYTDRDHSGAFSTHLMDPTDRHAWFVAHTPETKVAFGYVWRREQFPWLGIWEENYCRDFAPWNGQALTRGMEFGVSPMPENRRAMVERNRLFGTPCYRWVPAKGSVQARYCAFLMPAGEIPESVVWDEAHAVGLS